MQEENEIGSVDAEQGVYGFIQMLLVFVFFPVLFTIIEIISRLKIKFKKWKKL